MKSDGEGALEGSDVEGGVAHPSGPPRDNRRSADGAGFDWTPRTIRQAPSRCTNVGSGSGSRTPRLVCPSPLATMVGPVAV